MTRFLHTYTDTYRYRGGEPPIARLVSPGKLTSHVRDGKTILGKRQVLGHYLSRSVGGLTPMLVLMALTTLPDLSGMCVFVKETLRERLAAPPPTFRERFGGPWREIEDGGNSGWLGLK